ncbi:MAG: ComEC/Rec2 family competence protein [Reyranellaceae bacterium]
MTDPALSKVQPASAIPVRPTRIAAWLAAQAAEERGRWALWLPAAFGSGIGVYFALPFEPPLWPALTFSVVAAVLAVLARRTAFIGLLLVAAATIAAGFAVAKLRSDAVAAPVLEREMASALSGTVANIEPLPSGLRIRLEELRVERLEEVAQPGAVRVTVRRPPPDLAIGDRVSLRAVLIPPSPPAAPGAYDFQRDAWFRGLGAVGYAISPVAIESRATRSGWRQFVDGMRQEATRRIIADGSAESAMAAALLTGEQSGIPEADLQAMRDSGLAHLLSISGLHMVLVVALLLGGLRLLLALIEPVALRWPIRKWAAIVAFAGALFYLLLAGSPIPAQRAFIMAAVVLLAIVIDRNALSMRTVALAAMVILILAPESLLSASFHMSFAAVLALIAGWEWLQPRLARFRAARPLLAPGPLDRIGYYLAGVVLTTLIAGTASGLFGLYHFNRLALYGAIANMAAVPITGFWVMPWGILAMLLMPLGLEQLALEPMRWGLSAIIWVAGTVASWPGSAPLVPALPSYALPLFALGGLWLCLWRRSWRLLGIGPIAIALLSLLWTRAPDLLISEDAESVAVRTDTGALMLSRPNADRFRRETWTRRAGDDVLQPWPQAGTVSDDGALRCDALGCVLRRQGQSVTVAFTLQALAEDCGLPGMLVSLEPARAACRRRDRLIDFFDLRRSGTHVIWLGRDGVGVRTVAEEQGDRPWSSYRVRPAR